MEIGPTRMLAQLPTELRSLLLGFCPGLTLACLSKTAKWLRDAAGLAAEATCRALIESRSGDLPTFGAHVQDGRRVPAGSVVSITLCPTWMQRLDHLEHANVGRKSECLLYFAFGERRSGVNHIRMLRSKLCEVLPSARLSEIRLSECGDAAEVGFFCDEAGIYALSDATPRALQL